MSNANTRADLADKMEIIGRIFEIDGMTELLRKFEPEEGKDGKKKPIGTVRFNAVVIQISALLLKNDKELSDKVIAMSLEEPEEKIQELDDGEYAAALRNAIIRDVMGFFASSQPSGGRK
ncbi:MAG: hypothetical protein J6Y48_14740 [Clostridia bacterium]|nr:hypothetical protein [Clostridia bacterium]